MGHVPKRAVGVGWGEARPGAADAGNEVFASNAGNACVASVAGRAGRDCGVSEAAAGNRRERFDGVSSLTGSGQALWRAPGRFTRSEGAGNRWALRIARAASLLTDCGSTSSPRTGTACHERERAEPEHRRRSRLRWTCQIHVVRISRPWWQPGLSTLPCLRQASKRPWHAAHAHVCGLSAQLGGPRPCLAQALSPPESGDDQFHALLTSLIGKDPRRDESFNRSGASRPAWQRLGQWVP